MVVRLAGTEGLQEHNSWQDSGWLLCDVYVNTGWTIRKLSATCLNIKAIPNGARCGNFGH